MQEVTVVIPNFNGIKYIRECLRALHRQTQKEFSTIVVDNGSSDGSDQVVEEEFPYVRLIRLGDNFGFCRAVNEGIYASDTPYVILLNNDTRVDSHFVQELLSAIKKSKKRFSCAAKMIQYKNRSRMDDAGNFYCALGWAYARGKDKPVERYQKERKIFASCGGAAIYSRKIMEEIGYFDEEHFAYLEDTDIGYRARIYGYENIFTPKALVYHYGSGTSGSRYNLFKVRFSSRNNIYLIYKNMPLLQIILNIPFLVLGFAVKTVFFMRKGYGREYIAGMKNGVQLSKKGRKNGKKVHFTWKHLPSYIRIQGELYLNILRRLF